MDFSSYLLKTAKDQARQENLRIKFYKQNTHNINLNTKYDKIFLFFSEFGLFDANGVLKNVSKILNKNGLFLLDCDNVFRLIQYLIKHPKAPFEFNFDDMELKEKRKNSHGVKYYTTSELKKLFLDNGLRTLSVYGDYEKNKLSINSQRIILIGKKLS